MPRVSEAHLAARRDQILQAAWTCFARDGFHATSMQDVFAEAGLSAGAVYRYFPSKQALVQATAESIFTMLDAFFDRMRDEPRPPTPTEFIQAITAHVTDFADDGTDRIKIALNVWSEALRDPQIGDTAATTVRKLRGLFADLAGQWQRTGALPRDADAEAVASVLYSLTAGFLLQRLLVGDVTSEAYSAGLASLLAFDPDTNADADANANADRSVAEVAGSDA